jgi:hypothetical protein
MNPALIPWIKKCQLIRVYWWNACRVKPKQKQVGGVTNEFTGVSVQGKS